MSVDPRGPRFAAALTTVLLALVLLTGSPLAARRAGGRLRPRRVPGHPVHPVRLAVPAVRPAPAGAAGRARGRTAAAVRPGGRARLRRRRPDRSRDRRDRPRPGCHGARAGGRLPQRRVRLLPGLRGLPAHPPRPATPTVTTSRRSPHEPLRRPGRRRLGRGPPRRPEDRPRRGRRGHHAPTTRATSAAPSGSTGRPTCRTRSAATSSTRRSSRRCCPPRASATTTPSCSTAATTTGSPPTPTGTSSCTATTTSSCSTAAARSGSSTPASSSTDVPQRPATAYTAKEQDTSIRAFRDDVVAAIGSQNLVDVRSPDEYAGRLLAPAHLPQEQSQRAGPHPDGREHPVVQGGQRRRHLQVRRRAHGALRRRGRRPVPGHHRVLPDR